MFWSVKQGDRIVAVSDSLRDATIDGGWKRSRCRMVVDTSRFHPVEATEQRELRCRLSMPEDKALILFGGFFFTRKGSAAAVRCLAATSRGDSRTDRAGLCGPDAGAAHEMPSSATRIVGLRSPYSSCEPQRSSSTTRRQTCSLWHRRVRDVPSRIKTASGYLNMYREMTRAAGEGVALAD